MKIRPVDQKIEPFKVEVHFRMKNLIQLLAIIFRFYKVQMKGLSLMKLFRLTKFLPGVALTML